MTDSFAIYTCLAYTRTCAEQPIDVVKSVNASRPNIELKGKVVGRLLRQLSREAVVILRGVFRAPLLVIPSEPEGSCPHFILRN